MSRLIIGHREIKQSSIFGHPGVQTKSVLGSTGIESFYDDDSINDVLITLCFMIRNMSGNEPKILFGVKVLSVSLMNFMNEVQ
jgi:hypothetical protein